MRHLIPEGINRDLLISASPSILTESKIRFCTSYCFIRADFTNVISLNSNSSEAYYHRGWCYLNSEKYDLAIEDFNKITELGLDFTELYINRSMAMLKLNNLAAAIEDF